MYIFQDIRYTAGISTALYIMFINPVIGNSTFVAVWRAGHEAGIVSILQDVYLVTRVGELVAKVNPAGYCVQ